MEKSGTLKCFIKSPPEKGKANKELIAFFANALGLTKQDVEIIAGETSRKKRLKIHSAITHDQLYQALGLAVQQSILDR